jgi:hypothetical protein
MPQGPPAPELDVSAILKRVSVIIPFTQGGENEIFQTAMIGRCTNEAPARFQWMEASMGMCAWSVKVLDHLGANDHVERFLFEACQKIVTRRENFKATRRTCAARDLNSLLAQIHPCYFAVAFLKLHTRRAVAATDIKNTYAWSEISSKLKDQRHEVPVHVRF